ncbi:MAG: mechanosensitive ion channel family protein [Rhodobacteraceae bacterium]|nr:MAG: mechanosensitive ion channel family protein [Paracoccaceae bacterium]
MASRRVGRYSAPQINPNQLELAVSPVIRAFCVTLFFLVLGVDAARAEDAPTPPAAVLNPDISVEELTLRLVPLTRDELAATADAWLDIMRERTQAVVDAELAARGAAGETAAALRAQADGLVAERDRLFRNFVAVVNGWEQKGGDADAIAALRAYRTAIVVEETRTADVETLTRRALAWATSREGGVRLAIDAAVVVAALLAAVIVARLVRRGARRTFGRIPNLSKLLQAFLAMAVYWVVLAVGLMVALSAIGVDISPVFALFGGAAFILAFALQDTLGNLAAGLMIMINRPFDEGDFVDIGGTAGVVKAVSIVATTVTTPDNQVIVIPNASVWGSIITNVTTSPTRRVDLTFGISYGDSIEQAQEVLEAVVSAHPLVLREPAPVIRVHALGDSSVDFIVRPWVNGGDYWTVYWDLTRQVKEAFDKAGISIPFPQRDVHMRVVGGQPADGVSPPTATVSAGPKPVPAHEPGVDD